MFKVAVVRLLDIITWAIAGENIVQYALDLKPALTDVFIIPVINYPR
jgi:hypothetical protein